jgi:hypothetical protein
MATDLLESLWRWTDDPHAINTKSNNLLVAIPCQGEALDALMTSPEQSESSLPQTRALNKRQIS